MKGFEEPLAATIEAQPSKHSMASSKITAKVTQLPKALTQVRIGSIEGLLSEPRHFLCLSVHASLRSRESPSDLVKSKNEEYCENNAGKNEEEGGDGFIHAEDD